MKNTFSLLLLIFLIVVEVSAQKTTGAYSDLSNQIMAAAKNSDIICLGEDSHRNIKDHTVKNQVLKDVVNQIPTGEILFEAPPVTSVIAYLNHEPYWRFVWPFWNYGGLRESLDSITNREGIVCLGFDPQETCNFQRFSTFLIAKGYLKDDTELAKMDSLFATTIATMTKRKLRRLTQDEVKYIQQLVDEIRDNIIWPRNTSNIDNSLIELCLENRTFLAQEMTFTNYNDRINFRDSIMARNIHRINEIFKPEIGNKKVIVWAANLHIARRVHSRKIAWMIERYLKDYDDRVLSIAVMPRKPILAIRKYDFSLISRRPKYLTEEQAKYDSDFCDSAIW